MANQKTSQKLSMKIKVSEASGPVLDWMVAKANGASADALESYVDGLRCIGEGDYCTDWSQGGPIIETKIDCLRKRSKAEEASLAHPNPNFKFKAEIFADIDGYFCAFGPTPLIAAMRCYVASKLGEEVEVPEELPHEVYCVECVDGVDREEQRGRSERGIPEALRIANVKIPPSEMGRQEIKCQSQ